MACRIARAAASGIVGGREAWALLGPPPMPTQPTFPGVYVEELPSGVRTIAGVPTSITAFVGRAVRGPVNQPVVVNGYGDYERVFGGLSLSSSMSYAVRDYFNNGGGQAVIVRLFAGGSAGDGAGGERHYTPAGQFKRVLHSGLYDVNMTPHRVTFR